MDPALREIFGPNPNDNKGKETALYPKLIERWDSWIKNGSSKEEYEAMEKNYSLKAKCHLGTPILNGG